MLGFRWMNRLVGGGSSSYSNRRSNSRSSRSSSSISNREVLVGSKLDVGGIVM